MVVVGPGEVDLLVRDVVVAGQDDVVALGDHLLQLGVMRAQKAIL